MICQFYPVLQYFLFDIPYIFVLIFRFHRYVFAKVSPEVIGHFNATRTAEVLQFSPQTEMPNSGQTGLCRSRSPSTEDQIGRHLGLELIQLGPDFGFSAEDLVEKITEN